MKCIIPGVNVKVFGRAIHSLARIGDELYMEPLQGGLALRTVNSSRSAYACFLFTPKFFIHYNDNLQSDDVDEKSSFKCKIGMKSCLSVFKSLSALEKSVDRCQISMLLDQARLIFTLYCKYGIVKTYKLAFIECESLQAVFSKNLCTNIISAQTRLLSESVGNFQSNQEEVSLIVSREQCLIKNYIDDEPDPTKVMRTELTLNRDEFVRYEVQDKTEVTFCLKELRAILTFSEMANMPITLNFSSPGKPIVFCIENECSFEANFVLATLAPEECQRTSQISHSNGVHNSQQISHDNHGVNNSQWASHGNGIHNSQLESHDDGIHNSQRTSPANGIHNSQQASHDNGVSNSQLKSHDDGIHNSQRTSPVNGIHNSQQTQIHTAGHNEHNDVERKGAIMKTTVTSEYNMADDLHESTLTSPVIPLQATDINVTSGDKEEEDDQDVVAGTPPSKKCKLLFFGLSQCTEDGGAVSQPPPVLAGDTDDEND